jgi:hypothetical protein
MMTVFCSKLMRQYGTNSALVNDCIFMMMHHVAGDLASPHTLYIPSNLQSFSRIWEQGIQICEDWVNLIGKLARQISLRIKTVIQSCESDFGRSAIIFPDSLPPPPPPPGFDLLT